VLGLRLRSGVKPAILVFVASSDSMSIMVVMPSRSRDVFAIE
jgi:hypothetical protein